MIIIGEKLNGSIPSVAKAIAEKDAELIKDRECIHCDKFFECKGKPPNIKCINFTPRKDKNRT